MKDASPVLAANGGEARAAGLLRDEFLGKRGAKKLAELYRLIDEAEKAAAVLALKAARAYFDAGAVLAGRIQRYNYKTARLSAKTIAEMCGFPERRIALSLKIFKAWEHNPDALKGISLRDAVKMIAPAPESGEGYNRIEFGGDPGQPELDFGELFRLPAATNSALKNHRTIADYLTEIVVVSRTDDGRLVSKCFARFSEDIPQDKALRSAYQSMAWKTQAAIEEYLAALEELSGSGAP